MPNWPFEIYFTGAPCDWPTCEYKCLKNSCQVRSEISQGSCSLPTGKCSGLPLGCGSCVNKCSGSGSNLQLTSYKFAPA